jgi:hypothetical protein
MKAIVVHGPKDLRIEESPVETPGPGEVRLRLAAGANGLVRVPARIELAPPVLLRPLSEYEAVVGGGW